MFFTKNSIVTVFEVTLLKVLQDDLCIHYIVNILLWCSFLVYINSYFFSVIIWSD